MGSDLVTYVRLGLAHIADPRGYDHILFVAALTGGYAPSAWRRLLVLVTAFTVGHSVTLALATLQVVRVNAAVVEALIPATILATALFAVAAARGQPAGTGAAPRMALRYTLAAVFGLIHGLGFSNYLRALLGGEPILVPLLGFNLGLEAGQLLIVLATLALGTAFARLPGYGRRDWVLLLAGATGGVSLVLLADRLPALTSGGGVP